MIKMTPLMKELLDKALEDGTPCLIGTASKEGRPQISPKGSVAVFDDDKLCYWERSHRSSQKRIAENLATQIATRLGAWFRQQAAKQAG